MERGLVYWTPRVLSIAFIAFLALLSLDIFDLGLGFWGTALGLLIHNIPAIILLAVTIVVAGIAYLVLLAFISSRSGFEWGYLASAAIISGAAFLIGALYLIGWRRKTAAEK